MHHAENREKVLSYIIAKGLCSREHAEWWYEHEQIPAMAMETPKHIVRTGQINALLDYLEVLVLEEKWKQEGTDDEEDDYKVQVFGDSLGMNHPDKNC